MSLNLDKYTMYPINSNNDFARITKFDGTNYQSWKFNAQLMLEAKGL